MIGGFRNGFRRTGRISPLIGKPDKACPGGRPGILFGKPDDTVATDCDAGAVPTTEMTDPDRCAKLDGPVFAPGDLLLELQPVEMPQPARTALLADLGKRLRGGVHLVIVFQTREAAELMKVVFKPDR